MDHISTTRTCSCFIGACQSHDRMQKSACQLFRERLFSWQQTIQDGHPINSNSNRWMEQDSKQHRMVDLEEYSSSNL